MTEWPHLLAGRGRCVQGASGSRSAGAPPLDAQRETSNKAPHPTRHLIQHGTSSPALALRTLGLRCILLTSLSMPLLPFQPIGIFRFAARLQAAFDNQIVSKP